jgi:hypothetical protein
MKNSLTQVSKALAISALGLTLTAHIASAQSVNTTARTLAARWWQWATESPTSESPVGDPTGQFGALNQPNGNVWFLAGNNGGTTVRTLTIPSGKALFFPIVNLVDWEDGTATGGGGKIVRAKNPVQTAQSLVTMVMATANGMSCSVDGIPVPITLDNLEVSTPFAFHLGGDNVFGVPAGVYYPAIDSGYYVMLPPLSPGQHTIHFAGTIGFFGFSLDVTYNLTVQ